MINEGDRVRLVVPLGPFLVGAEGVVKIDHGDGNLTVAIDKNETGESVDPPFPLPPSPSSKFEKVG